MSDLTLRATAKCDMGWKAMLWTFSQEQHSEREKGRKKKKSAKEKNKAVSEPPRKAELTPCERHSGGSSCCSDTSSDHRL
eukprot:1284160-Rhodomonas_salina.3